MRARHRELTEKYKAMRFLPSALFLSRLLQTFFNKFTKRGKKALARRHIHRALVQFRMGIRRPVIYYALIRLLRRLRVQFLLIAHRKGRKLIDVPTPVRRNKYDILNVQSLYKAITRRTDRQLADRIAAELQGLAVTRSSPPIVQERSKQFLRIFEERVNMEYR